MKKKIRGYIKQFFLIDDTPHKVAGGAALGIFLGIIPGEGVLATLLFASIFRLNRLAALAGVFSVNMWSMIFVLPPAAAIGGLLFRVSPQKLSDDFHQALDLGWRHLFCWDIFFQTALPLLAGFFVIAGILASMVYFGLLHILIKRKKAKEKDHILTKDKMEL